MTYIEWLEMLIGDDPDELYQEYLADKYAWDEMVSGAIDIQTREIDKE